ncbi:MAG: S9 family peptidase [Gemmatimonadales bacterium]|nr:S9 family peptidase [Gemmatimonadales bacterium]MBT3958401.1 S9 family peptidase [Gemmatimonadales bacterium]MBT4437556.1 S9 family peptidase [Gemmatimonadales bacterium]MBT5046529.1 S9 family peptidase [Gemmatimonadales bacterium]MBT6374936.1 S9 family peptidase [Gemmatimonadales bacterium]
MAHDIRKASAASGTAILFCLLVSSAPLHAQERPMNFMDVQELRNGGDYAPSPDGQWMLYTTSTRDWQEDDTQTDIYVVSMRNGFSSARQLTYTDDKNESQPTWATDGSYFVFASNRDSDGEASGNQLYRMRHDGGEARKLTEAEEGVSGFSLSPDGQWLVYRSGESGEEQLYRMAAGATTFVQAEQITHAAAGVGQWDFSPDGGTIYFSRPDSFDEDEKRRVEEGFTVDVRNGETPLSSLWAVDVMSARERVLERDDAYSVAGFTVSPDGAWIAFSGGSPERYERNITQARLYADPYLLEVSTGHVERLAENYEVGESRPNFSPDSRRIAFSGPDDMTRYSMTNSRIYVRDVADRDGSFRKLGGDLDENLGMGFWSDDGETIYTTVGVKVTRQLHAVDVESGSVRQITNERAVVSVSQDDETGVLLINYQDPLTPTTLFTVADVNDVTDRSKWTQLTDINPQVRDFQLGEQVEVEWTSTDGKTVGGVLVYPVGYQAGQRYPLVVAIHGGPASADLLGFNDGYGSQIYAGAGYAVLMPNYRGSTNYGNAHRTDIVGDYFTLGYDDIMTGVDHLISEGIVDEDQMGVFGWSAGGHWSNWILTQTDRFKAISSGAGTMNWISMYAQSDVQRNRQFYLGDEFMYENFEPAWDQSPLKYIANASTPTMIHVVEGDPRVPSPQSVELHMALKKLDVPTELFMYPGRSHGIPDARNRLVRSVSELAWMDHYVRGIGDKFDWQQVLETLEEKKERPIS